ncbi:hypothetical protein [Nevskia sp.]|uniref:hypothetical protein n=1 Tax=Nevskia sp. TaxID=1929292 RepID=UPI0025FFC252|nr:hypothetical protein [Nevskia sp.]
MVIKNVGTVAGYGQDRSRDVGSQRRIERIMLRVSAWCHENGACPPAFSVDILTILRAISSNPSIRQ